MQPRETAVDRKQVVAAKVIALRCEEPSLDAVIDGGILSFIGQYSLSSSGSNFGDVIRLLGTSSETAAGYWLHLIADVAER